MKHHFRRIITICALLFVSAFLLSAGHSAGAVENAAAENAAAGTGLYKLEDGRYHYLIDGVPQDEFTGLYRSPSNNNYYYIKNGIWQSSVTSLIKRPEDGKWIYIKNGYFRNGFTGVYTSSRGKDFFLIKGVWEKDYSGLARRSSDKKWVYVKEGVLQSSFTGLYRNPSNNYSYYIKNGVWQFSVTSLIQRSEDGKWIYIKNGYFRNGFTGVYTSSQGIDYFLIKGVREKDFTGLAKRSSDKKWVYVKEGTLQSSFTGLYRSPSNNNYYYIKNGVWQSSLTSLVKRPDDGKWIYIKNGYFRNGFTGVYTSSQGKDFFLIKGVWEKDYTGLVKRSSDKQYVYVKKGVLQSSFTGLYQPSGEKAYCIQNGVWKIFTGIWKDGNGERYYIRKGLWNKTYTGRITYKKYLYDVANGKVVSFRKYTPLAARKVILISIDGMRPDGFQQCGNPYVSDILQQSRYTLSGQSVYPTWTFPVHYSVFHGISPDRHGITDNYYHKPWEYVNGLMEHLKANGKTTAMFYGWETIGQVAGSGAVDHAEYHDAAAMTGADRYLTQQAIACLQEDKPDFLFLYLVDTDDRGGHAYGWMSKKYLSVLSKAIDCVKMIREAAGDEYTVLIMTDHGGHGKSHGTDLPEDMTVPFFALGPDFEGGSLFSGFTVLDIAPTVSELMGLAPDPGWEGQSLLR